jgi:hypothetical protein
MRFCTAVIGAGRMGSVIAAQLPRSSRRIIIDIDLQRAVTVARRVGGKASDTLRSAADADLAAVVLPAAMTEGIVAQLVDLAKPGAMILNMATAARIDPAIRGKREDIMVVDAKIIGHAGSITEGEAAMVVVDSDDEAAMGRIRRQLPGFRRVVAGEARWVEEINRVASTEGIRAAVRIRQQLSRREIPDEWIDTAIRAVCAGTLKAFVENDLGDFARTLARKIEGETTER